MKAIILAAGIGKRLWPITAERPKCLLKFSGQSLLERMLIALEEAEVREVVIVVGYLKQMVIDAATQSKTRVPVRHIVNHRYQKGSILSLWLAREEFDEDLLILDADVLYPSRLLSRLVHSVHANAFLLDPRMVSTGEEMMLTAHQGRVMHIGRQMMGEGDTIGESVGFCKLTRAAGQLLRQSVEQCLRQGKIHADYEQAFLPVLREYFFGYEQVEDVPWMEIDTPADVERAEREIVAKLMWKGLF